MHKLYSHDSSLQPISILTHEYERKKIKPEVCMHDSCRKTLLCMKKTCSLNSGILPSKRQIRVNRELINIRVQHNGKRTS